MWDYIDTDRNKGTADHLPPLRCLENCRPEDYLKEVQQMALKRVRPVLKNRAGQQNCTNPGFASCTVFPCKLGAAID